MSDALTMGAAMNSLVRRFSGTCDTFPKIEAPLAEVFTEFPCALPLVSCSASSPVRSTDIEVSVLKKGSI